MKKKFLHCLSFTIFIFLTTFLSAQQPDNKYDLLLMSGTVFPKENAGSLAEMKFTADEAFNGKYYRIIQFYKIPSDKEKEELQSNGVDLLIYLPNMAYYASINKATVLSNLISFAPVRAIIPVAPQYKTHPSLKNNALPLEAEVVKGKADLIVTYYMNIASSLAEKEVKAKIPGIKVLAKDEAAHWIRLRVKKGLIEALTQLSFVQYVEPVPQWYVENNSGTTEHRSNTINNFIPGGLRYDGTGVGVSIGDGGAYFGHVDFTGRQTGAVNPGADHGTHVAGTIGGAGNVNPRYRGQAPGVNMVYFSSFNDISTLGTITNLFNGAGKIRVTNHSLAQTENAGYTSDARQGDLEVDALPSLFNVHSAGNNGSSWFTITGGYKAAKNCIATGSLDYKDVIASYSSRGPSKDGRIKPDVCAKGDNVQSSIPNNTYGLMSGTSMASPGDAGCIAQLIHAYRSLNGGSDPLLAQLKGIILNTAEDLGNTGPDYTYGWGRLNVWKAYNVIKENRFFSSSVSNGEIKSHSISVPSNVSELKVMVYWADPAAAAGVSKALINDLDITLSDGSQTYNPWLLNSASPSTTATKGQDRDNNMEQVSVLSPAAGNYTLTVNGYQVPQGPQEYWVTYEYITDEIKVLYPLGGESFVPAESEYIRWDANGKIGTFTLEYSTNGGISWTTISSTVSGSSRYFPWIVPNNTVTGKALVRVSRNGNSSTSEANFNILGVPTGLKIDWRCAANFQLSWKAVTGATAYEVFLLGQKYMMPQTITSNLNCIVTSSNAAIRWASVRALADSNRTIGRRAVAIQAGTSLLLCIPTTVNETGKPSSYGLSIYPNPITERATVSLYLEEQETVSVKLIDVFGKEVAAIIDEKKLSGGEHRFLLDGITNDGIYFVVVKGSRGTTCGKVMVVRN